MSFFIMTRTKNQEIAELLHVVDALPGIHFSKIDPFPQKNATYISIHARMQSGFLVGGGEEGSVEGHTYLPLKPVSKCLDYSDLTLVLWRVFSEYIFRKGVLQPSSRLSILKVT